MVVVAVKDEAGVEAVRRQKLAAMKAMTTAALNMVLANVRKKLPQVHGAEAVAVVDLRERGVRLVSYISNDRFRLMRRSFFLL